MGDFFSTILYYYDFFIIDSKSMLAVIYTYIGVALFIAVIRALISSLYERQYHLMKANMKPFMLKKEIKDTKSKFLNGIIKEYMIAAEKGVSGIDVRAIVVRQAAGLKFFGWSLKSMEKLVQGFHHNLLMIGVLFAVLNTDYTLQWSVLAVLTFIALKILNSFLDYTLARENLIETAIIYVNREIGQFYQSDLASSVTSFKTEMKTILEMQTKMIGDAVIKAGTDLSGAVMLTVKEADKNTQETLAGLTARLNALEEPIDRWMEAIGQTERVQKELNVSYGNIKGFTEEQLQYLSKNQALLNESIGRYEQTFEQITSQLGEALGRIVDYSLKNTHDEMSENMNNNLNKLTNASNDLVIRIKEIFDSFIEGRRNETNAILNLKDQMDLQFEAIKKGRD